ncbi:MAG: PEGA domain-containing protein, partial [Candidatus Polarisedimenticolia bacterium]
APAAAAAAQAAGNVRPASPRPPSAALRSIERGVLTVAASVEHAEVFIDGALVGTTPLVDLILMAGPHELQVKKAGFRVWSRRIHVVERAASRFFAEMEPARETR